eukprot:250546_1
MHEKVMSIFWIIILHWSNAEWIAANITIQQSDTQFSDTGMAICSYNESIYLVGGYHNGIQLVEYKIEQNAFFEIKPEYGFGYLSEAIYGSGQYYSQSDNTLYMITPYTDYSWCQAMGNCASQLSIFNVENQIFTKYWNSIDISTYVSDVGCLASANDFIFIVGGHNTGDGYLNTTQILNLSSLTWITDPPSMNQKRGHHSCIVHPLTKTLYSIGGAAGIYDGSDELNDIYLNSIEKISITNIQHQTWSFNINNLTSPASMTRSVTYENNIFVIGGFYYDGSRHHLNTVHIIDVMTGTVTMDESLAYNIEQTSVIIVDNIMYAFGGYGDGHSLGKWQYYNFLNSQMTTTKDYD